jgi:VanZ family protein
MSRAATGRPPLDRWRLARWLVLYIVLLVYSSIVLGPMGWHFVKQNPALVWQHFLRVSWVAHGSDQRADWMANLTTLIPLGFMTSGLFASGASRVGRWAGVALAALFCAALILAVKYAQLYVPPRTVTLNYIAAQGAGAAIGIAGFLFYRRRGAAWLARAGGRDWLLLLWLYGALTLLFFLMPFDFVLSGGDVRERLRELPGLLVLLPGEGRGRAIRALLALADSAITVPIGVLLGVLLARRSLVAVARIGAGVMIGVFALALLVLSAAPSLAVLALHILGVAAGAALTRLTRQMDWMRLRRVLAVLALPLALAYLAVLVLANGLLTPHFRDFAHALAEVDPRLFMPLYAFYIVSKAQAAMSVAVHAAMYVPVGVIIWMRNRNRRHDATLAAMIAAVLALAIETARWLKPGMTPDFNEVFVAAFAAGLAVKGLDVLWRPLARVER